MRNLKGVASLGKIQTNGACCRSKTCDSDLQIEQLSADKQSSRRKRTLIAPAVIFAGLGSVQIGEAGPATRVGKELCTR